MDIIEILAVSILLGMTVVVCALMFFCYYLIWKVFNKESTRRMIEDEKFIAEQLRSR